MQTFKVTGKLVKDPEIKQGARKDYCLFTLAVKNNNSGGEAEFLPFVVFGQPASYLAQYGFKGQVVEVEFIIQNRKVDEVYKLSLIANKVELHTYKPREQQTTDNEINDPNNGDNLHTTENNVVDGAEADFYIYDWLKEQE